eukprot:gene6830-164_t
MYQQGYSKSASGEVTGVPQGVVQGIPLQGDKQPLIAGAVTGTPWVADDNFVVCNAGVNEDRRFRDAPWGCLFIVFLVSMAGIAVYGYATGSLETTGNSEDDVFKTLEDAWHHGRVPMFVGVVAAVGMAYLWLELIHHFTKVIVWASLIASVFWMAAVCVLYVLAVNLIGLIFGLFALLLLFFIFTSRERVQFTIHLIKESTTGLKANASLLYVIGPVLTVLQLLFIGGWFISLVALLNPKPSAMPVNGTATMVHLGNGTSGNSTSVDNVHLALGFYQVFGLYWVGNFFWAVLQCVFAGTIASWYFTRSRGVVQNHSLRALGWALTYHFGSLALGSMILAIIQFLRFLARVGQANVRNGWLAFVILCIRCLLACIEGIIRWLTRYAYVYVAMHGMSFCEGAKATFNLWERSGFQMVINDSVVGFVVMMGTLMGSASVGGWLVTSMTGPASATIGTAAFLLSLLVFGLLGSSVRIAVDTLMVCYVEDMERHRSARYCSNEWHQAVVL